MNDLQDIAHAARPPMTETESWKARQKRWFVVAMTVGLVFFVGGLGWMTRPDHDAGPGLWAVILGFLAILAGGWFGLRALVGEPPEA
ncbi:MAG: hypothetical protein V4510_04870 [bacterium]